MQVELKAPPYVEYFQTEVQSAWQAKVWSIARRAACPLNPKNRAMI